MKFISFRADEQHLHPIITMEHIQSFWKVAAIQQANDESTDPGRAGDQITMDRGTRFDTKIFVS